MFRLQVVFSGSPFHPLKKEPLFFSLLSKFLESTACFQPFSASSRFSPFNFFLAMSPFRDARDFCFKGPKHNSPPPFGPLLLPSLTQWSPFFYHFARTIPGDPFLPGCQGGCGQSSLFPVHVLQIFLILMSLFFPPLMRSLNGRDYHPFMSRHRSLLSCLFPLFRAFSVTFFPPGPDKLAHSSPPFSLLAKFFFIAFNARKSSIFFWLTSPCTVDLFLLQGLPSLSTVQDPESNASSLPATFLLHPFVGDLSAV